MMYKTEGSPRGRRAWRGRSAAETLELALALPLLLVIAFGTIEFGYWFYLEHNFQSAAREGARAAIVYGFGDDILARQLAAEVAADAIMEKLKIPKEKYQVNSFPSEDNDGDSKPDYLTVTVEADWSEVGVETGLFMGLHGGGQQTELVDNESKIVGKVMMRIEF